MDIEYEAYLRSDWWKMRADLIKRMADNKCECCGRPFDLQVHHYNYDNVGMEKDYQLVCLCKNCHQYIEAEIKKYKEKHDKRPSIQWQEDMLEQHAESLKSNTISISIEDFMQEFVNEYYSRDYSQGGDLDFCQYSVIDKYAEKLIEERNYNKTTGWRKLEIQGYFRNRRYEVILEYMAKGYPEAEVHKRTKFSNQMVNEVYKDPEKAKRYLKIEEERNKEE